MAWDLKCDDGGKGIYYVCVWACVVVVERCGEGCGCVSYSRGMCGGVSMRVVGWTRTLYYTVSITNAIYGRYGLPMDLYASVCEYAWMESAHTMGGPRRLDVCRASSSVVGRR